MIRYLAKQEIKEINRRMTLEFGGHFSSYNDNLLNPNALEYLLEAPDCKVFGVERYPDVFLKAAVYSYYIIKDHIFIDGNKRTGIESAFLFLKNNGYRAKESLTNEKIVNFALSIEKDEIDINEIAEFLSQYFIKV